MKRIKLFNEDNLQALKKLPDNSIDSVVSDPPYGLSFMNKKWDYDVPSVDFWKEVYRVLKPGGHVLSFGGTRTYHRMVVNMEDAGFEIRDQIQWIYGSGFPKSHNIGKAVDKLNGVEREVVGERCGAMNNSETSEAASFVKDGVGFKTHFTETRGSSEYEGWGTALKPANEPICLARKPLSEKSVAENVLKWKTGGINVDGCRVGTDGGTMKVDINKDSDTMFEGGRHNSGKIRELNEGRFPANIILECICDEVIKGEKGEVRKSNGRVRENHEYNSVGNMGSYDGEGTIDNYNDKGDIHTNPECPCYIMDQQSGESKSSKSNMKLPKTNSFTGLSEGSTDYEKYTERGHNDKGGASRFFYQAKVSKAEIDEVQNIFNEGRFPANIILECCCDEVIEGEKGEPRYGRKGGTNESEFSKAISPNPEHIGKWFNDKGDIHTNPECPCYIMDQQSGESKSLGGTGKIKLDSDVNLGGGNNYFNYGDKGGASRFFYQAKVSKAERNMGLDGFDEKKKEFDTTTRTNKETADKFGAERKGTAKNTHPTVKPINLLTYLCRLVTPPNGIVLDPFMGSGSTGIAAQLEGFRFVGMELDEDYFKIAEARIQNFEKYKNFQKNK